MKNNNKLLNNWQKTVRKLVDELRYQFWKKSLRKNATVELNTFTIYLSSHLLYSAITPKSEDKYVEKVFNLTELHFSEVTSFKIGTLISETISVGCPSGMQLMIKNLNIFLLFRAEASSPPIHGNQTCENNLVGII